MLERNWTFLKGGIRMLGNVSGSWKSYSDAKGRHSDTLGTRLELLEWKVSGYQWKVFGCYLQYPDTEGRHLNTLGKEASECLKEASEYVEGHPDTRKSYLDMLQLKLENSDKTTTKTRKTTSIYEITLGNQPKRH